MAEANWSSMAARSSGTERMMRIRSCCSDSSCGDSSSNADLKAARKAWTGLSSGGCRRKASVITGSKSSRSTTSALVGKYPKKGALGDLGLLDDLLHGGCDVALLREQPERVCLDLRPCSRLLALTKPHLWANYRAPTQSASFSVWTRIVSSAGAFVFGQEDHGEHDTHHGDTGRHQQGHVHAVHEGGATERSSDAEWILWATATPPKTLWRTAAAAAVAGRPDRSRRPR